MNTMYTNTLFSKGALRQDFFLMLSFKRDEKQNTCIPTSISTLVLLPLSLQKTEIKRAKAFELCVLFKKIICWHFLGEKK